MFPRSERTGGITRVSESRGALHLHPRLPSTMGHLTDDWARRDQLLFTQSLPDVRSWS